MNPSLPGCVLSCRSMRGHANAMRGAVAAAGLVAGGLVLAIRGALTIDLGVGRRLQQLGPLSWDIDAPARGGLRRHRRAVSGTNSAGVAGQAPGLGAGIRHGVGGALHARAWATCRYDCRDGSVRAPKSDPLPSRPRPRPPPHRVVRASRCRPRNRADLVRRARDRSMAPRKGMGSSGWRPRGSGRCASPWTPFARKRSVVLTLEFR